MLFECVINVSEGSDEVVLSALAGASGACLLDLHADPDHQRSVFTLGGPAADVEEAARTLARAAVALIDLRRHQGAHPRFGAVDVVPFAPLDEVLSPHPGPGDPRAATGARDAFCAWAGAELALPCFCYGPCRDGGERTLPEVRRRAFVSLPPDAGPATPHPTAGACAVGARAVLVAYNVWLEGRQHALAADVARAIRGPAVRALAFELAGASQVSCNLVAPLTVGPAQVFDQVSSLVTAGGGRVARAELVGLAPGAVVHAVPPGRWAELDLSESATLEARLEERGFRTRSS